MGEVMLGPQHRLSDGAVVQHPKRPPFEQHVVG